ncbi:MAG TPA: archaellin/type IV pilin N-terminal domain-containing protein [Thermoplasmata archaeon]|jgi:flagellin-like protein|nr:archaellin/type IV pilin N-terminal domain-containing protein [Thermoplasmata archaeon]
MNVFGKRERSWRKARKRGVSPIIATILLVAITVVLAAVLYVLISGLTHGTGSAPLGTNFSWGTPINTTGVASTGCSSGLTAPAHAYCYSIEIAGSSVTTSNFILELRNAVGATIAWPVASSGGLLSNPAATTQIALISPTSTTPVAGYATASTSWTLATGFSGSVSGGFTIVINVYYAAAGGTGLLGDQIVAIGGSGYSGSVPSNSFS